MGEFKMATSNQIGIRISDEEDKKMNKLIAKLKLKNPKELFVYLMDFYNEEEHDETKVVNIQKSIRFQDQYNIYRKLIALKETEICDLKVKPLNIIMSS